MANTDTTLPPDVAEAKVLRIAKRLIALSDAAANRDWNEFSMRVPAEPERDADLVLTSAAQELVSLAEENARLRESAQQIERECLEAWKQATHSRSCAKVAEAERDALKARIAEAKRGRLTYGPAGIVMVAGMTDENIAEIVGAAVALLKLEDGERE